MSKFKCDCGGQLKLVAEKTYEESNKVLTNGKLSKKSKLNDVGVNGASLLQCTVCDKEYEYNPESNGRFSKGEKRI